MKIQTKYVDVTIIRKPFWFQIESRWFMFLILRNSLGKLQLKIR